MKYHLRLMKCIAIFYLLSGASVFAQGDAKEDDRPARRLGIEVYDSIKVDVRSGSFPEKYIPFDVPFKLYGSNKDIESIHLKIIDAAYQACSDQYDLYEKESGEDDCNCDCKSISDKRLEFFRMVRRIKNGDVAKINEDLRKLRLVDKYINEVLWNFKASQTKTSPRDKNNVTKVSSQPEMNKTRGQLSASREMLRAKKDSSLSLIADLFVVKMDPYLNRARVDASTLQFKKEEQDITRVISYLWEEPYADQKIAPIIIGDTAFHANLKLKGFKIKIENFIGQAMVDSTNLSRFLRKHLEARWAHTYDSLVKAGTIEKRTLDAFEKRYGKNVDHWKSYAKDADAMIRTDSLAMLCTDCGFNPSRCNVVCSWERNIINGDKPNFNLIIPALAPNRNYKFFFEVARKVNDTEKKEIQFFVNRSIVQKIDSIVDETVDMIDYNGMHNIDKVRAYFFKQTNYEVLDTRIVKEIIAGRLKQEYGHQLTSESVSIDRIHDQHARRALIDQIIANKYYRTQMATSYQSKKINDAMELLYNKYQKLFDASFSKFFEARKMDKFYLLDTLRHIVREDASETLIDYSTIYQNIRADVTTGLTPFNNLQKIGMRKLEDINDFNPRTVEPYIKHTSEYAAFLTRVQTFIGDDLIRGAARTSLFGSSGRMTDRDRDEADGTLKTTFTNFYMEVDKHRHDVIRFNNVYKSYQENIRKINTQTQLMLDSLLKNNRAIQIASARTTGGFSSADFKTRAEWYVTADIGIAVLPISKKTGASVAPYFGANFNTHPLNRQVHYGLIAAGRKKRYLNYLRVTRETEAHGHPFWSTLWKGTSFVLGLTYTDLAIEGIRDNLMPANLNLLTGAGIRLTDAARLSMGSVWTKDISPNPLVSETKIKANWYVSLSFDLDVKKVLGQVGTSLTPYKPN